MNEKVQDLLDSVQRTAVQVSDAAVDLSLIHISEPTRRS